MNPSGRHGWPPPEGPAIRNGPASFIVAAVWSGRAGVLAFFTIPCLRPSTSPLDNAATAVHGVSEVPFGLHPFLSPTAGNCPICGSFCKIGVAVPAGASAALRGRAELLSTEPDNPMISRRLRPGRDGMLRSGYGTKPW